MSTPPNKLKAKLKAIAAARDATDLPANLPSPRKAPIDEFALRFEGNRASPSGPTSDQFTQDAISSDSRLQDDLDQANRNLTGNAKQRGKK